MALDSIRHLIADDFRAVDRVIHDRLHSDVALINQLGDYIVNSGGKRLRPMIVLLAAGAVGVKGPEIVELAAVIEFIHTATLLHDDVVDASEMRRGRETANELWGNEASVLVGDFLYSRAFQMMVSVKSMAVMEIMADATNTIAEGEVLQLMNCHDPEVDEARYLEVIRRKTATLFEAGARLPAVFGNRQSEMERALASYGLHLGCAFQIVDDLLDYSTSADAIGKNLGDDLAEGKPTLPLIHAMENGDRAQRDLIRAAIENGALDKLGEIRNAIQTTGALDYARERARREAVSAIAALDPLASSAFRSALESLATFAVERDH